MHPEFRRHAAKGRRYFYFDMSDPSHQKLLRQKQKIDPMATVSKATKIDEY